jgi:RNA polymerase sigma factor (sigma-70 family)
VLKGSATKLALRQIKYLFHSGLAGDLSDSELLDQFLNRGDSARESAFAALVERHGPMVFRVCNQTLKDHHDAQDAMQATFLVLARQAGAIRKRTSVASWLFGVARRAAGHIRMEKARRRGFELQAAERTDRTDRTDRGWDEPGDSDPYPELHAEIERLPEKYRVPIVLCYLEGLTHEQAAGRLRWPLGTVKIRLSRARERLRVQLEKRGRPYLFLLPTSPIPPRCWPALPEHLVNSITQAGCRSATSGVAGGLVSSAVVKLTEGVMKSMLFEKLKIAAVVLSGLFVLGLGCVVAAQQGTGKPPPGRVIPAAPNTEDARSILRLFGTTDFVPDFTVKVRAPFDCRVDRVFVDFGTQVRKGDALLELFSPDLAEAKNSYLVAKSQWEHDKKVLGQGNVLEKVLIERQSDEEQSRLKAATAKERLLIFGVNEIEIERIANEDGVQKAKMILRSRSDGTVTSRSVVPGNFYTPTDILMSISRLDPLWVRAIVSEADARRVKVGQTVTVRLPLSDWQVRAKVEAISAQADPETHTVPIRTTIPNRDGRLKAGMFARLDVETDASGDERVEGQAVVERPNVDAARRDRLSELERKVDRLLGEKEERLSHAKILERLDALERKLDQVLNGRR